MVNFPTLRTEPLSFYWGEDDLGSISVFERDRAWRDGKPPPRGFECGAGVKEAIWVRKEQPSLNRTGGVWVKLQHSWNKVIGKLPSRLTLGGQHIDPNL